jgi:TRAP-type C4-dicarboxylate transport system permease small subunit
MKQLVDGYFRILKFAVVACISMMVVMVFGNVVLRYLFNSGITVSEELSRWCFVWLTFIGGVTAMRENAHLGMDSVVSRLSIRGKKVCYVISHLIMILCALFFLVGSWHQTIINIDVEAPATGLSSGFFYGIGVFFSVSVLLILFYDLYALLSGRMKDEDLVRIRESEEELDEDEIEELQHAMEKEMKKPLAGGGRESQS